MLQQLIISFEYGYINLFTIFHSFFIGNYTGTVWNKAVFSNRLKSLRGKSRLCRWAGISFQAVGPEEPKERTQSKTGRAGPWYQQFVCVRWT